MTDSIKLLIISLFSTAVLIFLSLSIYVYIHVDIPDPQADARAEAALFREKLEYAERLEAQEDYGRAAAAWDELLTEDPNNPGLMTRVGYNLLMDEDYSRAQTLLEQSLEINSEDIDTKYYLGRVYQETEQFTEGKLLFEEILDEDPHHQDVQFFLGLIYLRLQQPEEAKALFIHLVEAQPNNIDAKIFLGHSYLQLDDGDAAKALFSEALELEPENAEALKGLVQADKLLSRPPYSPGGEYPEEIAALIEEATAYEKESEFDKAAAIWCRLYLEHPEDAYIVHRYGQVQSWRGHWKQGECLQYLSDTLDPGLWIPRFRLGYIYMGMGREREAVAQFRKLHEEAPDDADVTLGLARAYNAAGCMREAYHWLNKSRIDYPCDDTIPKALYGVNQRLRPSLRYNVAYGQEREVDLFTNRLSAERRGFGTLLSYTQPLNSHCRFITSGIYGFEREINLINGTNNFYIPSWIIGQFAEFFPVNHVKLSCGFNIKRGWNNGLSNFPFRGKTKYEPEALASFTKGSHIAYLRAGLDSFIVKDFFTQSSFFLRRRTLQAYYRYQFIPLSMYIGADGFIRSYNDSVKNKQQEVVAWFQVPFPKYDEWMYLKYETRLGTFKRTDVNYYSYRSLYENGIKGGLYRQWKRNLITELSYYRGWRTTHNLSQPVSSPVFIARQFLVISRAAALVEKLYSDTFWLTGNGEYYRDSSGYRGWAVRGEFRYIF